jgi:hypothetical protein
VRLEYDAESSSDLTMMPKWGHYRDVLLAWTRSSNKEIAVGHAERTLLRMIDLVLRANQVFGAHQASHQSGTAHHVPWFARKRLATLLQPAWSMIECPSSTLSFTTTLVIEQNSALKDLDGATGVLQATARFQHSTTSNASWLTAGKSMKCDLPTHSQILCADDLD